MSSVSSLTLTATAATAVSSPNNTETTLPVENRDTTQTLIQKDSKKNQKQNSKIAQQAQIVLGTVHETFSLMPQWEKVAEKMSTEKPLAKDFLTKGVEAFEKGKEAVKAHFSRISAELAGAQFGIIPVSTTFGQSFLRKDANPKESPKAQTEKLHTADGRKLPVIFPGDPFMPADQKEQILNGMRLFNVLAAPVRASNAGMEMACNSNATTQRVCSTIGSGVQAVKEQAKKIPGVMAGVQSIREGNQRVIEGFEKDFGISRDETTYALDSIGMVSATAAIFSAGPAVRVVSNMKKLSRVDKSGPLHKVSTTLATTTVTDSAATAVNQSSTLATASTNGTALSRKTGLTASNDSDFRKVLHPVQFKRPNTAQESSHFTKPNIHEKSNPSNSGLHPKSAEALKNYSDLMIKEKTLVQNLVPNFSHPKLNNFPKTLNTFLSRCDLHAFSLTGLGPQKGKMVGHLPNIKNGKDALFVLQSSSMTRDLVDKVKSTKLIDSEKLHAHERIKYMVEEIKSASKKMGIENVFIAYDPTKFALATVLTEMSEPIVCVGKLSKGEGKIANLVIELAIKE